ncbi:MAG TPA: hypothetical protein VK045_11700 [Ornithinicoccus sp.]|nr:hypothetical protein [Ornithinicoccus sp.]
MNSAFATQSVTFVEPALIDDRGTLVPDWDDTTDHEVPGCEVQPGASEEAVLARQGVTIRWTVFAPAGTPVTAHWGAWIDGKLYQVDGEPLRWSGSISGRLNHVIVYLVDHRG